MDRKQMIQGLQKEIAVKVVELNRAQMVADKVQEELCELRDLISATVREYIKEPGASIRVAAAGIAAGS